MSWNGLGVFDRLYSWVSDATLGILIRADRMDAEFNNYKGGLENCLTRDGQTPATANLPMGAHKITGLANGTVATDAAAYGQLFSGAMFRKNLLRNAAFNVWQAGVAVTMPGVPIRTSDCWWANRASGNATVTRTSGYKGLFGLKVQRNAANAAVDGIYVAQSLETTDCQMIQRTLPTLTLSFWGYCGANFSAASSQIYVEVLAGTGTSENVLAGYTGGTLLGGQFVILTTTPQKFSFQVPSSVLPTLNELAIRFSMTPTGVAGSDDGFYLEQVQLEIAPSATDFEFRSYQQDLIDAQRYYYKTFPTTTTPAQAAGLNGAFYFPQPGSSSTSHTIALPTPPWMRDTAALVLTTYNPISANAFPRNTQIAVDYSTAVAVGGFGRMAMTGTSPGGSAAGQTSAVHYVVADSVL